MALYFACAAIPKLHFTLCGLALPDAVAVTESRGIRLEFVLAGVDEKPLPRQCLTLKYSFL